MIVLNCIICHDNVIRCQPGSQWRSGRPRNLVPCRSWPEQAGLWWKDCSWSGGFLMRTHSAFLKTLVKTSSSLPVTGWSCEQKRSGGASGPAYEQEIHGSNSFADWCSWPQSPTIPSHQKCSLINFFVYFQPVIADINEIDDDDDDDEVNKML